MPVFAYCPEIAVPVAVQVTEPPGAIATRFAVPWPQSIAASSPILSSTTVVASRVLPVFVTTYVQVTVEPMATRGPGAVSASTPLVYFFIVRPLVKPQ